MDKLREKLMGLIAKAKEIYACDYTDRTEEEYIAETLLDNGVTVQETTHLVCTGNDEYYGPFGICHNCETDNICGSKFCRECGAKIEVEI